MHPTLRVTKRFIPVDVFPLVLATTVAVGSGLYRMYHALVDYEDVHLRKRHREDRSVYDVHAPKQVANTARQHARNFFRHAAERHDAHVHNPRPTPRTYIYGGYPKQGGDAGEDSHKIFSERNRYGHREGGEKQRCPPYW